MKYIIKFMALLLLLTNTAQSIEIEKDAVLKPTFMTGSDSFTGGTAFVCKVKEKKFIITAHHLFGPACGLDKQYSWKEAPVTFSTVTGISINSPKKFITSNSSVIITGAKELNKNDASKDLAAYEIPIANLFPSLVLSEVQAKVGEKVRILARVRGQKKLQIISGTVTESKIQDCSYVLDDSKIVMKGTSGAPVLNEQGKVIAIHIGSYDHDAKKYGVGNPCTSIINLLKKSN